MKLIIILWLCLGSLAHSEALPNFATIDFDVNPIKNAYSCPDFFQHAKVVVEYDYNFQTNKGQARLKQINTTRWVQNLYPTGITKFYGFMSDMAPTTVHLPEGDVSVYRVIFNLYPSGKSEVYLMIGASGECIMHSN